MPPAIAAPLPDPEFIAVQSALAGEYSLERELGRGGMGVVYLAREVALDRLVAIKVLPESMSMRPDLRERFLREARTAARLSHPHIVPIHRVGDAGGVVYFAMAYVRGETLGQRLRDRGPLPPEVVSRVVREVAWALAYAHAQGVIHRDVKPDNILLEADSGRALVTDFGIARASADDELTDPGRLMGTAHFMSPEQGASASLDGRSDLYSLGVVAYLALTGRPPFDAPSVPALLVRHASEPVPPMASVAPGVPARLAAVVERCLSKAPEARFATGEELADALGSAVAQRRELPMPLRVWAQQRDPLRPLYLLWSGMFAVGAASGAGLFGGHGDVLLPAIFAALPILPSIVFHARKAEKALSAGYTLGDLRAALKAWLAQRREELAIELSDDRPKVEFSIRAVTFVAIGTMLAAGFRLIPLPRGKTGPMIVMTALLTAAAGVAASNAFGVPLIGRRMRKLEGSVRTLFWNSRAGEWFARILSPRNRAIPAEVADRPTEIALALAVDDLFDALPRAQQRQLEKLPETVRELEAHAAEARRRLLELEASPLRAQAQRELTEVVTMLESIRLDLLRLHAGTSDLAPLTAVLERAQEIGNEIEAVLPQSQPDERTPV